MSAWMPGHGPQMCTGGLSRARTCSCSAVLVPLLCVIPRLEMPRCRGSWQGGIMPLEMTSGMNDILWEERMTSLPSQFPPPPPPQAQMLFWGEMMPLQQVVEGSQGQQA